MFKNSRKAAMAAGESKYLTGKPCKYGHYAYRYSQSGACAECISQSAANFRESMTGKRAEFRQVLSEKRAAVLAPIVAQREERVEALRRLIKIKVAIMPPDLATVFDTAIELCLVAHPCLTRADVSPDVTPIKGLPLYEVSVPVDQIDLMRQVASALYTAHSVDIARVRDRLTQQVERMAEDDATEPPEGWK